MYRITYGASWDKNKKTVEIKNIFLSERELKLTATRKNVDKQMIKVSNGKGKLLFYKAFTRNGKLSKWYTPK